MDAEGRAGGGCCAAAESDQHTCCTRAPQVQCSRGCGSAADDDGHVEFIDELPEVQRFLILRHVLGRNGCAADDEQVDACSDDGFVELLGALRRQCARDGDTASAHLCQALADQLSFDRLGVDLL